MILDNIAVSIICNTYNQESYIKDALESFVKQKTTFKFEVLVHDDASTDKTPEIIREYEQKYPDIIKPLYQTENQYSKGGNITLRFQVPRARGKYLALCEGDDYWTCDTKLQEQWEYMEAHPECSLVTHETMNYYEKEDFFKPYLAEDYSVPKDRIIPVADIIRRHSDIFHTSSLFYKKDYYNQHSEFLKTVVGYDYVPKTLLACQGTVYMIPKVMSVHRIGAKNSCHERWDADKSRLIKMKEVAIDNYTAINQYTAYKYNEYIEARLLVLNFQLYLITCDKNITQEPYKSMFANMPLRRKCAYYINVYCPWCYIFLRGLRRKLQYKWKLKG